MIRKILIIIVAVTLLSGNAGISSARESAGDYKIKRLIAGLDDSRTSLSAERQLASYGDKVIPYLLPVLKEKARTRARIAVLKILAKVGNASAEDSVAALLSDPDKRIRQYAARALSTFAVKDSTIAPLKALMNDYDAEVRFNAIRALSRLARDKDVKVYITSLNDYDPRIRKFAVNALGKIKSPETIPYLLQMVNDFHPDVRYELVNTLFEMNDEKCLDALVTMTRDVDPTIRVFAVERISQTSLPGTEKALIAVAGSSDPNVSSRAITALGRAKSTNALKIAKEHLNDEHLTVKLAAIGVLGEMGGKEEENTLSSLENAESTLVRQKAREALADMQAKV